MVEHVWDLNPPVAEGQPFPVFHEKGVVGLILKSLVGYNGNPSLTEVAGYLTYWLVVGVCLVRTYAFQKVNEVKPSRPIK